MKQIFTILAIFISLSVSAQFPAPTAFNYSLVYVHIEDFGVCNGKGIAGPSYCSTFSWQKPDLTSTTATLSGYKIYWKNGSTVRVIATPSTNSFEGEIGIIGDAWVTAVYTNPDGESLPSNIKTSYGLPIAVPAIKESEQIRLTNNSQQIELKATVGLVKLNLINSSGRLIKTIANPTNTTDISSLPTGFYIVEIFDVNQNVSRWKIIK